MDVVLGLLQITVHLHDLKQAVCLIVSLLQKRVPKCLAACDMFKECVFIAQNAASSVKRLLFSAALGLKFATVLVGKH